jgi:hypothetical protein
MVKINEMPVPIERVPPMVREYNPEQPNPPPRPPNRRIRPAILTPAQRWITLNNNIILSIEEVLDSTQHRLSPGTLEQINGQLRELFAFINEKIEEARQLYF